MRDATKKTEGREGRETAEGVILETFGCNWP